MRALENTRGQPAASRGKQTHKHEHPAPRTHQDPRACSARGDLACALSLSLSLSFKSPSPITKKSGRARKKIHARRRTRSRALYLSLLSLQHFGVSADPLGVHALLDPVLVPPLLLGVVLVVHARGRLHAVAGCHDADGRVHLV